MNCESEILLHFVNMVLNFAIQIQNEYERLEFEKVENLIQKVVSYLQQKLLTFLEFQTSKNKDIYIIINKNAFKNLPMVQVLVENQMIVYKQKVEERNILILLKMISYFFVE